MRSPWLQLMLLLLYLLLVLLVAKLLDLVLWYQHGMISTQLLDPLLLSVRQLKLLLDNRGISYADYFEKQDLAQLLKDSGDVSMGEMAHVQDTAFSSDGGLKPAPTASFFSGGAHFYEEVEDTRDGVWLVQVITSADPLLDDYSWRLVCNQLEPFGVRMGIFDCRRDPKHCEKKGWKQPLLLLAMPKGTKPKDKVVVQPFTSNKPQIIVNWVRHQLSSWVKTIQSVDELMKDWLILSTNVTSTNTTQENIKPFGVLNSGVRVLLLTHLLHPPLFLAALSIKFTGRVRFGMFTVKKEESEAVLKVLKAPTKRFPCYLLITPEKTIVYGHRRLEYFNLQSMNAFLRGIQPEMNDVFLCSLIFVNMLVSLSIFMVSTQLWWKWAVNCVWVLVSYNLWLFSMWLLILAAGQFAVYDSIVDYLLTFCRVLGLSSCGSVIRTEWTLQFSHPALFCGSFACYVILATWALRKYAPVLFYPPSSDSDIEMRAWWEVLPVDSYWVSYLFRPMTSLPRPLPPPQVALEDGIDLLIERLAVPNFWLQPVISSEYIKDLPMWQFRGWNCVDDFPSGSSNGSGTCIHASSPKLLERIMDGDEPRNVSVCHYCVCSQDQTRLRSSSGPKSSVFLPNPDGNPGGNRDIPCSCMNTFSGSSFNKTKVACASSENAHSCLDSCSSCNNESLSESVQIFCCHKSESCPWREDFNSSMSETEVEDNDIDLGWKAPEDVLPTSDCAVCLEGYRYGTVLCALPCGHNYHQRCILAWLQRDNHHCPVCRWPAYRYKTTRTHLHRE